MGWPEACILGGWVGSNMGCRTKGATLAKEQNPAARADVTAVTRPPLSGGTRHAAAFPRAQ